MSDETIAEAGPDVIVAGAGPGGLAAALALATRGVRVELFESSELIGGRVFGDRPDDGPINEHGVHGWWPEYRSFDRILEECGVDPAEVLRDSTGAIALTRDGHRIPLKNPPFELPSPLHGFVHLARYPQISFLDVVRALRFFIHLLAFDHERDYEAYDGTSMREFADWIGLPESLRELFLRPFAIGFDYAAIEQLSASSIMSALQFYMLKNQQAAVPRWPKGLAHEVILAPIYRAIESRGGVVRRRASVHRLEARNGVLQSVSIRDSSERFRGDDIQVPIDEIPADGFSTISDGVLVGRVEGTIRAFSNVCPHLQGAVQWETDHFYCPVHGGTFSPVGDATNTSVTPRPLRELYVEVEDTTITISSAGSEIIPCSNVVLATDVGKMKSILKRSRGLPPELAESVEPLEMTPVIVMRLWFEPHVKLSGTEAMVLIDSEFADVFFDLNAIDSAYDGEGTVVEIHCADANGRWKGASEDKIVEAAFDDLKRVDPKLRVENLGDLRYRLYRHGNFTLFKPGDHCHRPRPNGMAGVRFAGDWTRASDAIWMMERAVVSGLEAANSILRSMGLEPVEAVAPGPDGALLELSRIAARFARRWLMSMPDLGSRTET